MTNYYLLLVVQFVALSITYSVYCTEYGLLHVTYRCVSMTGMSKININLNRTIFIRQYNLSV
jgi:hypothetical protein